MQQKISKMKSLTGSIQFLKEFFQKFVDRCSNAFNSLSLRAKRISLILFGITTASICVTLIVNAINGQHTEQQSIDKITLPNDIHMNQQQDTSKLTPIGKMKGEINGEFEAFYLAVDREGQLYINRDPGYSHTRYMKSNGWEPITRKQLEIYEKELHFTPGQRKGMRK